MATLVACVPFFPFFFFFLFFFSLLLRKIIFCLLLLLLLFCSTVSFNKYSSKTRSIADEPTKTGAIKDQKRKQKRGGGGGKRGLSHISRVKATRDNYCTVITTI